MGTIQTVLGPLDPDSVTGVLPHEHLLSFTPGRWMHAGRGDYAEQQIDLAVTALSGLAEKGFNTVVDLSPYGVVGRGPDGANVAMLQEIARRSGMHILAGTAVYLEAMSPRWTLAADLDELVDRFIADATTGIGTTGIPAGVFGEQATSLDMITGHEEKCLRAAARAARQTGLALFTHTTHGTMAIEQLEILESEGFDLGRAVIGHMDTHHDINYIRRVLESGTNIAFDTIGKQYWEFFLGDPPPANDGPYTKHAYHQSDERRASWLAELLADGFEDRILLAQDMTGAEVYLNPTTHGASGLGYLGSAFTDLLTDRGVTENQLRKLTRSNPIRMITQA